MYEITLNISVHEIDPIIQNPEQIAYSLQRSLSYKKLKELADQVNMQSYRATNDIASQLTDLLTSIPSLPLPASAVEETDPL